VRSSESAGTPECEKAPLEPELSATWMLSPVSEFSSCRRSSSLLDVPDSSASRGSRHGAEQSLRGGRLRGSLALRGRRRRCRSGEGRFQRFRYAGSGRASGCVMWWADC